MVSDAFTRRVPLSAWNASLAGTMMDTWVYVFDSGVPGGSVLLLGGTHPYEPASPMTAYVAMENLAVTKGRVFVIAARQHERVHARHAGQRLPAVLPHQDAVGREAVPDRRPRNAPARSVARPVHVRALSVHAEPRLPGRAGT